MFNLYRKNDYFLSVIDFSYAIQTHILPVPPYSRKKIKQKNAESNEVGFNGMFRHKLLQSSTKAESTVKIDDS